MPATREHQQTKQLGKGQPGRAEAAIPGKSAVEQNALWQSLAFSSVKLQPKLAISQPDDPYEHEADRIADQVMQMATPLSGPSESSQSPNPVRTGVASPRVERKCDGCEEEEEKLQRKESSGNAEIPQGAPAPPIVHEALNSPGRPLDPTTRSFMEERFDRDFANVRVHTDARAGESARAVNALAYTRGNDIVLGSARYETGAAESRRLLAHELVHVLQQSGPQRLNRTAQRDVPGAASNSGAPAPAVFSENAVAEPKVQRALDPRNVRAWDWFSPVHRRADWRRDYIETLSAAAGAAMNLTELVAATTVPTDPAAYSAWRSIFADYAETLVRLNALGLMASHRATIEGRRDELLHPQPAAPGTAASARGGAARQLRDAAYALRQLIAAKEYLEISRSEIQLVGTESRTAICFSMNDCVDDWLRTMQSNIRRYQPRAMLDFWNERVTRLQRVPENLTRAFFSVMSGTLADWRTRQLSGVNAATGELYERFPLFKTLSAESVVNDADYASDAALMGAAATAYADLLNDVDEAIVEIGSADIHPFDLPVPLRQTRDSLPTALRTEFDSVVERHRTIEFWTSMSLTLAQAVAVFIPVIGPAIAFTIGAATAAVDIESLLDRIELSEASTSPEGEMLGVSAPTTFEYAMAAIQVILTAVDLGMVTNDLRAARPHLEEPHAPGHLEGEAPSTHARGEEPPPGRPEAGERPTAEAGSERPSPRESEASALDQGVHDQAHSTGAEVQLADGTHGVAAAGTGEARGFYFCSSHCALLTDKLSVLLEALPGNYPGREVFAELRNRAARATAGLRSGRLAPRAADAIAARLATDLNRLVPHFPGVGEMLNLFPGDLLTRAPAIRRQMARSLDAAEVRLAHGAETARPPRRSTIAPESPEGRGLGSVRGGEVPEGQRLPRATETPTREVGGEWGGQRGHSEWFSDVPEVNQITGYHPIQFVNGEANFRPWARARVILRRMTGLDSDFAAADRGLMRQYPSRWRSQAAVERWRSSERLTWHHEPDLESMTLVPMALHENVPHVGGASPARAGQRPLPYAER